MRWCLYIFTVVTTAGNEISVVDPPPCPIPFSVKADRLYHYWKKRVLMQGQTIFFMCECIGEQLKLNLTTGPAHAGL